MTVEHRGYNYRSNGPALISTPCVGVVAANPVGVTASI